MEFSQFGLNVLASVIASIIIILAAKITLKQWKGVAIGLSSVAGMVLVVSALVFSAITFVQEVDLYFEEQELQTTLDKYFKGHYPKDFSTGYRIEVVQIKDRVMLGLGWPEDVLADHVHPWKSFAVDYEVTDLLNDNGYPGKPFWVYSLKPLTEKQVEELMN